MERDSGAVDVASKYSLPLYQTEPCSGASYGGQKTSSFKCALPCQISTGIKQLGGRAAACVLCAPAEDRAFTATPTHLARRPAWSPAGIVVHTNAGKMSLATLADRDVVGVPSRRRRTHGERIVLALAVLRPVLCVEAFRCAWSGPDHLEIVAAPRAHATPRLPVVPGVGVHAHRQAHRAAMAVEVAVLSAQPPAVAPIPSLPPAAHTRQAPSARRGP